MNFNQVILAGNLTRDLELRFTTKGTAIGQTGIAVNRKWTNDSGEQKEDVTFVDLTFFGRNAENAAEYMRKGSAMLICGRLKLDMWDDKQTGQKRQKLTVVVETMQFGGTPNGGGERRQPERRQERREQSTPAAQEDAPPMEGDDVPFLSNNVDSWAWGMLKTAREMLLQMWRRKTAFSVLQTQDDDRRALG